MLLGLAPVGLDFFTVTPCRVADTRAGGGKSGGFGPPSLIAGTPRSFLVPSSGCNIPSTADAYSLNFTVVPQGYLGVFATWPTGVAEPLVSTLNSYNGSVVANAAIVPAGSGGAINVEATNATDVLFDINGYFAPPLSSGLQFFPVTPCRVADTRSGGGKSGAFGPPSMAAGTERAFPIPLGSCGIPATAAAYSLNFTVVPKGYLGFLTTWPTGQAEPNASTLNSYSGAVVANAAIVPAGTGGAIDVYVTDATDVVFDINGYFRLAAGDGLEVLPGDAVPGWRIRGPAGERAERASSADDGSGGAAVLPHSPEQLRDSGDGGGLLAELHGGAAGLPGGLDDVAGGSRAARGVNAEFL